LQVFHLRFVVILNVLFCSRDFLSSDTGGEVVR
jgi:hypothetical protein